MPTYAYACSSCGHRFDIYQAFTDDALTECPQCGGSLRKEFGNIGVVFKGSGFYRNDARKSGASEPAGSASPSASSGSSADSGGSGKESASSKSSDSGASKTSTGSAASTSTSAKAATS